MSATGTAPAEGVAAADRTQAENRLRDDQAAFGVIRRRAQRLQRRVEDMLRVARSESGQIELQFAPVALQTVCASAIDAFEGKTKRRDVVLHLEAASNDDIVVDGDVEWLRQIIEGMIDNALRYAKGATQIALVCGRDGGSATLVVRDDGPGWGVAEPQELLARFARRGGATESVSGHGIGLSLVRWVVDKHRGAVTLRTADPPLGGAEIAIRLPLASAQ